MKRNFLAAGVMLIASLVAAPLAAGPLGPPSDRVLLVTTPNAEIRSESGFYCETPCAVNLRKMGKSITFSKAGYRDVTLYLPTQRTPEGGARDIRQNANVEIARDYIYVTMGSETVNLNDNMDRR